MKLLKNIYKYVRNSIFLICLNFYRKKFIKKKYYISICAIFKNEAKSLEEWLNYYLIIGVEHFYLYNNFSDDNYKEILEPYINKGFVSLIDWPIEHGQTAAYNDCINKYSSESNWIGFIDLDEFVVPIKYNTLNDWLKNNQKYPMVHAFWKNFSSSGKMKESNNLITEEFIVCSDFLTTGKMFFNTSWAESITHFQIAHYCKIKFFKTIYPHHSFFVFGLSKNIHNPDMQINHYYCKSYEYQILHKLPNGSAYSQKNDKKILNYLNNELRGMYVDYKIYKYMILLKTFDLQSFEPQKELSINFNVIKEN